MKQLKNSIYGVLLVSLIFGFFSCDKTKLEPVASFANQPGYQSNDTVLAVGDTIKVLVDITWNGKNKVKEVELRVNDQVTGRYPLSIENGQFSVTIIKGLPETELWDFIITDEGGNSKTITLTLTKDPNSIYAGLKYYDSIFLGAQNNILRPGFMSLTKATYYTLAAAYMNQALVDLLFYVNDKDGATISSPGANLADGIYSEAQAPAMWTSRNTTYFQKVDIPVESFYSMYHDGYVKENFNPDIAVRKAKNLEPGDIYIFKLENGLKGIFMVLTIENEPDGEVSFGLKIQE